MCKDCGCEQALKQHSHKHQHEHFHTHDGHEHAGHSHPHSHEHTHADGAHVHSHDGHTHSHETHEHSHAHEHEHFHTHGSAAEGGHSHTHSHADSDFGPAHDEQHHQHEHAHSHETRRVEIERKVLAKNEEAAAKNRKWLKERGIVCVNFISSPGSGKTMLLERTLERLKGRLACGVIVGDQQTDNDAKRLSGKGAKVKQIETGNTCHLDAERVGAHLQEVVGQGEKLLFIENVGNLICPAAFDLGEDFKIALLSVTEGEDKPLKYPVIFSQAGAVVLTKGDLVPHLDWSQQKCRASLSQICPEAKVFELSAKTGQGMEAWVDYLCSLVNG